MGADAEVLIVGGGPVGLVTALALHQRGVAAVVLESAAEPQPHSRAIGIHPPALEILADLGVAEQLVDTAVQVTGGSAFGRSTQHLGRLELDRLPPPFPFVLACPQDVTEQVLESALTDRAPGALRRGVTVTTTHSGPCGVSVEAVGAHGAAVNLSGRFLIGADGHRSVVREQAGIAGPGHQYPESFVMGDFTDTTEFGDGAALFLHRSGLVESFPLPGGIRRWVASLPDGETADDRAMLVRLVAQRSGFDLDGVPHSMLSGFRVHRFLAERFVVGNTLLVGDAAHVMSPIGGQGMNVGWMDAELAATSIAEVTHQGADAAEVFGRYERRRRKMARIAIRRAERNMTLGLGGWWNPVRDLAVTGILKTPLTHTIGRVFTMRGLR